jgi:isocitrate dehydrogenase kinase/phosphatase
LTVEVALLGGTDAAATTATAATVASERHSGAVSLAFASALRAGQCAQRIVEAFLAYNASFRTLTQRAPQRFRDRDWHGSQQDAVERLELYDRFVQRTIEDLERSIGAVTHEPAFWPDAKRHFANLIEGLPDSEFCKTFFSSVTRRIFKTVGVAPEIEFVATDLDPLARAGTRLPLALHRNAGSLPALATALLQHVALPAPWSELPVSAAELATQIQRQLASSGERGAVIAIEVIDEVFYHFTRAYVVGRVIGEGFQLPLALALQHGEQGVVIDSVMLTEAELSTLFGYARSYLHVDLEHVADAVRYLRQLLPQAPVGELFTVLGRAKQGKTERHRSLMQHLQHSSDLFELAPGQRGLVMICFTMPSLDVVFKVIRDRIPVQKNLSRDEVQARYNFVFKHDRAGRLVDAQEFRRTRFPRARFSATLLAELQAEAGDTVRTEDGDLVFEHLYMERRVIPLDIYLQSAAPPLATQAALDYGGALRDLAYTNIFAGDLLAKNFGVTQHGRVVFYDYDEVVPLQDCRFRNLPEAHHHEEEMSAEPWFAVDDADVFPETFGAFLPFSGAQQAVFMKEHGELLTARFWQHVQQQLNSGAILEPSRPIRRPAPAMV